LCEGLEVLEGGCSDDEGGVVSIGVYFGVGDDAKDFVDVEEEEGGGE
jgi:hypothetical protein